MANCDKKITLSVIVLVTLTHVITADICRTPNGRGGTCVPLNKCSPLFEMFNRQEKSPKDLLFLRQSSGVCGFSFKPKVCCPPKSEWSTFKRPVPIIFPESEKIVGSPTSVPVKPLPLEIPDPKKKSPVTGIGGNWSFPIHSISESLIDKYGTDPETCEPTLQPPKFNSSCCGRESLSADKITNGEDAQIDQFPWMALLEYSGDKTVCGGSLISSRYVLTAAHCFWSRYGIPQKVRLSEYNTTSFPTDYVVVAGGGIDNITVFVVSIERSIIHPGYTTKNINHDHDIALVKLAKNAPYTDFIRPICLPTYDITTSYTANLTFSIAGWGSTGKTSTDIKLFLQNIPFVPLERCNAIHTPKNLSESQICAGGEKDRDTCKGDSGGPLMVEINEKYVLAGVVSFGHEECGKEGVPAVYTYVYKYLDWINKEMV